jgi:hypothetical protein
MNQKINKIFFLVILLIGFLGCQAKDGSKNEMKSINLEGGTQIKLKWLAQWYSQGERENFIRETAREFMFLHQNIDIELVFPHEMVNIDPAASNSKFVMDTIIEMVQQNKWPYDMMLCDGNLYNRIAMYFNNQEWGKEYLVDFKDKTWFIDSHKDNFFKSDINTEVFNGMAPGAFIEGVYHIMYVSAEVE